MRAKKAKMLSRAVAAVCSAQTAVVTRRVYKLVKEHHGKFAMSDSNALTMQKIVDFVNDRLSRRHVRTS